MIFNSWNLKKDIEFILNEGNKMRTVGATNMNAESSRSHGIFCIKITQTITHSDSTVTKAKQNEKNFKSI
jgi:kinesin family member 1